MNEKLRKITDYLLRKSYDKFALQSLNKLLNLAIPFNIPHKFKYIELSDYKAIIEIPYSKLNQNHLGGIHACAIATLGEYPAGLIILKHFGIANYRIIMKDLKVDYIKQAKESLRGQADLTIEDVEVIKEELREKNQSNINMITNIMNSHDEVIAIVQTTWQLKNWKDVSFQ